MFPIDFVVTWVDGADEKWLERYNKYSEQDTIDVKNAKYRDYGIFNYWFRALENYAPWVNKIFLVTDGQLPEWLNTENNKLCIIDHKDFIPEKYLPVFNSSVIEMNLHRIEELSEHYVYFNDDFFINSHVKPTDFFSKKGLPRDTAGLNAIQPAVDFDYIHCNNMKIINNKFDKKAVMKKQFFKFVNPQNLELNIYTLLLLFWPKFTRFFDLHFPYSILKSEQNIVVSENINEYEILMNDRFRGKNDITIWLVRYYQLCKGKFSIRTPHFGKAYHLYIDILKACNDISKSKHKIVILHDDSEIDNQLFLKRKEQLNSVFEKKLPNKSSFEL